MYIDFSGCEKKSQHLRISTSKILAGLMVTEADRIEIFLLFELQKVQEVLQVINEHTNVVLVERRERQHCAELHEQSQQVKSAVDLRHWLVGKLLQDVSVLRPLDLVEQL